MSSWPATLPQSPLAAPYADAPQSANIRSTVEAGPPKVRRRFTAKVHTFSISLLLTAAQTSTFETFYDDTIAAGATAFTWVHPRTGAAASVRISSEPSYRWNDGVWLVSFNMEVLP